MKARTRTHFSMWIALIGGLIAAGVYWFHKEFPEIGFWEALYSSLRLFVFERDLDPFPHSWPLIALYFIAPLIALSAFGAAISYLFRLSPGIRTRFMSNHIVICGVGRTGRLLAETLEAQSLSVVGVDLGPEEIFDEWLEGRKLAMLFGDCLSRPILKRAGAFKARSIIFASGDDLLNLEGAVGAYDYIRTDQGPKRLIWAHIADERLAATAEYSLATKGQVGIRFFDTYKIAATRMIAGYFNRETRQGITEATILGLGKFGRDLFEVLVRDLAENENFFIHVLDKKDRSKEVYRLAQDLKFSSRVDFNVADIHDIELVDKPDKAFFLCTDDDLGNLTGAMMLTTSAGSTHIYVRMTRWPIAAVADKLGEDKGVVFININDLVKQGIQELPGIFEPE